MKVRLPWTPEEKHRLEVSGHAEYDNRSEIGVRSSGSSSHVDCTLCLVRSITPSSENLTVASLC